MKKYESLYKIMSYVYHHDRFTLRDLMTEFSISKSTALRYVKSLEDIGVPLYSEPGRYGGYQILDTYAIPPVTFTPQETYALFFALKAIESLGTMPFRAEYEAIEEKFMQSVSPKIKAALEQIGSRISFGTVKLTSECPQLEDLLQAIMKPSILRIEYQSPKAATLRRIQPIGLFAEQGSWYCPSLDIDKEEYRVFRCDRIVSIERTEDEPVNRLKEIDLANRFTLVKKSENAIDYRIELSPEGKSIQEISDDPRATLTEARDRLSVTGWIEPAEMPYLLQHLHRFGTTLLDIHPSSIKQAFLDRLGDLTQRLQS